MMKIKSKKLKTKRKFLQQPRLRFSPTAWAKLLFLRDYGDTEVGGFGITTRADLLFVEDVQLMIQDCSWAHIAFDDNAVADYFDQQVDAGRQPSQFGRVWIHTHPGNSPQPSLTDEETFDRVFGSADWAVMFILARGGKSYARLRYNTGPTADLELRVEVDFSPPFGQSNTHAWEMEYLANVFAYCYHDHEASHVGEQIGGTKHNNLTYQETDL